MILTDVIDLIRQDLTDTEKDYRFKDPEVTAAIDGACLRLIQDRPDLQLADDGTLNTITGSATIALINDRYQEAIVHFACYKLFLKDGEDTHNADLAKFHLQAYNDSIL